MVVRKVLSEEVMVTEDRLEKENKETFLRKQKIFVEASGRRLVCSKKPKAKPMWLEIPSNISQGYHNKGYEGLFICSLRH